MRGFIDGAFGFRDDERDVDLLEGGIVAELMADFGGEVAVIDQQLADFFLGV